MFSAGTVTPPPTPCALLSHLNLSRSPTHRGSIPSIRSLSMSIGLDLSPSDASSSNSCRLRRLNHSSHDEQLSGSYVIPGQSPIGGNLMIDWMTLRIPIDRLGSSIHSRLQSATGRMVCIRADGTKAWVKAYLDIDQIRSDMPGLYWTIQGDAHGATLLTIGGSPASIEHGINVFGSDDIRHCANILVRFASCSFDAILPPIDLWQCRRLDITENYDMGSPEAVKQALRILLSTDSTRRRATSDRNGGDSVYWSPKSDLISGKAYHKGPQIRYLHRKNKLPFDDETVEKYARLADQLLRLELKLGSRWFRRTQQHWLYLEPNTLRQIHIDFFSRFIGKIEVTEMSNLRELCEQCAPTIGQGRAAYCTWLNIRAIGYDQAKASTPRSTWYRSLKVLRAAGLSDSDLCSSNVVPLRRKHLVLTEPVLSWDELRKAS